MQKKILIVEDTDDVREMYSFALQQKHQVDEAIDGEQAVQKIMTPSAIYDLILLDVMLPKMDGISILKKIKAPDSPAKNIPVFLFTNLGMDEVVSEATSLGAVKCFVKANILPETILKEIDEYFANPQAATPSVVQAASGVAMQSNVQQPASSAFPSVSPQPPAPTVAPTASTNDVLNLDQF